MRSSVYTGCPGLCLESGLLHTSKPPYSRVKTVVDSRCLDARIKPFLVSLRAFLMIQTCVNILAVDFPIYPRRFVKTELYGTSLMDIGVGSFLFCHGLVSGRSIAPIYSLRDCIRSLRGSLPMLILGLVRLSGIKAVDYQVGVLCLCSWLVWLTTLLGAYLGVRRSLELFLYYRCRLRYYDVAATFALEILLHVIYRIYSGFVTCHIFMLPRPDPLLKVYQALLVYTPLEHYILWSPRYDFISSNREGIFSLFGYGSIFLIGMWVGSSLFRTNGPKSWSALLLRLVVLDAVLWVLFWVCLHVLDLCVSRRLVCTPGASSYCLFCLANLS